MYNKVVIVTCLLVGLSSYGFAKTVNYKDCGSVSGSINTLDLAPCDSDPCVLKKGNNYTATVNFTSKVNSTSAKTNIYGIIHDVPVPFPVPSDCCNNHNLKCPIVAGTTDIYSNYVFCSPEYPSIRLIVKWEVKDDQGKDIFCFEVPLTIA